MVVPRIPLDLALSIDVADIQVTFSPRPPVCLCRPHLEREPGIPGTPAHRVSELH
jgi:hypothetical protein